MNIRCGSAVQNRAMIHRPVCGLWEAVEYSPFHPYASTSGDTAGCRTVPGTFGWSKCGSPQTHITYYYD
jgi:hypothetical protein